MSEKKLNIILFFNCQGQAIISLLKRKLDANYKHLVNYIHIDSGARNLPVKDLENADIVIFQFVNKKHGICSTDPTSEKNILKFLKKDCIRIGVPNPYQTAFWPILDKNNGLEIIRELKKNNTLDDIINMYKNNEIDFKLQERFDNCEKHTRDLELYYLNNISLENYDVIEITPFIRENYKKYKLFCGHCHPSAYIYAFITNEIIDIINTKKNMKIIKIDIFNRNYNSFSGPKNKGWWLHNSKYVKKELNLEWMDELNESHYINSIK